MKRELAFALGSRSLILDSAGKTRSNRAPIAHINGVSGSRSRKRLKRPATEEPVAFNCLSVEIDDSGIRSSDGDEINEDLVDNNVIGSRNAGFNNVTGHYSIDMGSKEVVSGLENGLFERKCDTEVKTRMLDEPVVLDSSVDQIEEPSSRCNGDLPVEGKHSEKTPTEIEVRDAISGLVQSKCDTEVEAAVTCTSISKNCSVMRVEIGWCSGNDTNGIKDDCAGNSNIVNDSLVQLNRGISASGLGNCMVEKLYKTEPENVGEASEKKEVAIANGNTKALAEKPQRRFTRSALKVNDKDPMDILDVGTNTTTTENEENHVAVDLHHRSEDVDVDNKDFNDDINGDCTRSEAPEKLEVEELEQICIAKIPRTVRELFETGVLEGCKVYYNGGKQGPGIRGIVKGDGILCYCNLCQGRKVVCPAQFEIHACNSYRRAAQYICLENGRSFIDILQLCRGTELKKLEMTLRNAIGSLAEKEMVVCRYCKESFSMNNVADRDPLCNSCTKKLLPSDIIQTTAGKTGGSSKFASTSEPAVTASTLNSLQDGNLGMISTPKPASALKCSGDTSVLNSLQNEDRGIERLPQKGLSKSSRGIQMEEYSVGKAKACRKIKESTRKASTPKASPRPGRKRGRPPKKHIQAHNSCTAPSLEGSSQRKAGKITRKDLKMHRLVFDDTGLPDGTELAYFARGQRILEGYKKDSGIFCRCCNEVVSASQFEAHAGFATRRKPYSFIYTSNGVSLHELAVSLLKSSQRDVKESDDLCIICAEGGTLLLCDGCPRAFHIECASLTHEPRGKWFCRYCESAFERDRYVQWNVNAVAAGRVSGVDPIKQISNRSIRMVKDFQEDATSCYLCRGLDFAKSGFGPRTILICDQCEREYHVGCLKTHKMADLEDLPQGEWFCNTNCEMIRSSLQSLLNREAEKLPNNLVDVIKDKLKAHNAEIPTDFDVRWRLLSGQVSSEAIATMRPLLSQAISILHEGFGTIVDGATGRDLIPSIVYGRKVRNREFRGMYCAVLLVNSLIASVAVFRLFGQELVELPLVATRGDYRGKGYFQALFGCIERLFTSYRVKSIVLPAAEGAEGVWLKFGFKRMNPDQVSEYKKTYWQITEFTGVVMLEKQIPDCEVINPTENASETGICA